MRCTYCGNPANTLDHVVPHSFTTNRKRRLFPKNQCVPACQECNSLLGNLLYLTVGARAGYLVEKLMHRYAKELKLPEWADEDLDELSPSLSDAVAAAVNLKRAVKERIQHCAHIGSLSPSVDDVWAEENMRLKG